MASASNTYELTYIVNAVISDNQIQDLIARTTAYVTENGGEIIEVDQWGSRRLAFPIQKKRNGFYVNMYFRAPGSIIARLERALEIDDNILRYLTMKMDAKMIRYYIEQKTTRKSLAPVEDSPRTEVRKPRPTPTASAPKDASSDESTETPASAAAVPAPAKEDAAAEVEKSVPQEAPAAAATEAVEVETTNPKSEGAEV